MFLNWSKVILRSCTGSWPRTREEDELVSQEEADLIHPYQRSHLFSRIKEKFDMIVERKEMVIN